MELSGDTPVTLVIKAPNQRMADQTVECMTGWTIQKLKQHLEMVYPTKPKHNEQRLIYSGRLLQDKQTLKEILRQYDDSLSSRYTIHLVCSSIMDSSSASTSSSGSSANSPVSKPAASVSSGTCSSETVSTSQTDGIRHRGHHQLPQPSSSHDLASAQLAYTAYQPGVVQGDATSYTPEQYHWMMQQQQQMYSQYMMQYMMYYQCMYNPGLSVGPMMPPAFSQHIVGNTHPQQQVPLAPDAAAAVNNGAQEAARPNVRMNAQGGVEEEEDDEGEPRDWLHHMYFFMRVLTFLGILFFYSNLTRFLIVFTGSFCIYALQKLRKYWQHLHQQERQQQQQAPQQEHQQERQQQQQAPQQEQQQEPNEQIPQQQPETPADVRNEEVAETVPPAGPQAGTDQQPAVEENGSKLTRIITFIGTTVQSFFTSLLPTPPELLEPN